MNHKFWKPLLMLTLIWLVACGADADVSAPAEPQIIRETVVVEVSGETVVQEIVVTSIAEVARETVVEEVAVVVDSSSEPAAVSEDEDAEMMEEMEMTDEQLEKNLINIR